MKSEISSLKNQLYQVRKDIRDKNKYIFSLKKKLLESEKQVKKLQYWIKTILSQKNSSKWGNFSDLYNFNDNMATITKLANIIDGFVNNLTTAREIIADQIKRITRQICWKYNGLHQDLAREQRKWYDIEVE